METSDLFFRFGVATIIGILIGLQREYTYQEPGGLFAGVRTLGLMGLSGCTAAFISDILSSPWPFVSLMLILGAFLTVTYFIDASQGQIGLTTEMAAVVTALSGALTYWGHMTLAVAIGVTTTVLLAAKWETHRFVTRLTRVDIIASLKFAIISVIVLPVLPNETFGPPPFDLFNPYKIWLLVVLISGISFVGYVLVKVVGAEKGIGLMGLLGGLASSTAVTLSFTQRSQGEDKLAKPLALAITIAWTVMFGRVVVAVTVVNYSLLNQLLLPMSAVMGAGLAYSLYLFLTERWHEEDEDVTFSNPFELGPAIKFGLLFTIVLLISRAAQFYFGNAGIYLSSLVSGLADADAIALSVAELHLQPSGPDTITTIRAIVLASVANTFAKGIIVLSGGSVPLRRAILPGFLLMMLTGVGVAFIV